MRNYHWLALALIPILASCARQAPAPPLIAARSTAKPATTPTFAPAKRPLILTPFEGAPPPPSVVSLNQNLLFAAEVGDVAGIQAALAKGADINVMEDRSKDHTPLTYAAENGYIAATRFLLQRGANPDGSTLRDKPQWSPLFAAADNNQIECARLLLRAGADPDQLGPGPVKIIEVAVGNGNIAILNMLMGRMPDLDHREKQELRHQALSAQLSHFASVGSLKQVRAALDAGGDVNDLDAGSNYGTGSPLMRATDRGDLPVMKLLLQRGAKANLRDSDGSTALMYVGRGSYYFGRSTSRLSALKVPLNAASTRLLLHAGADLKMRDKNGMTALMYSAQGNADATALLLARGADIEARDNQKRTALHWAAEVRDDRSLRVLLRHGAQINARDAEGATALMLTSVHPDEPDGLRERADRTRSLKLLRRAGADSKITDNRGKTAADYRKLTDGDFVNAS